jgi:putative transposase
VGTQIGQRFAHQIRRRLPRAGDKWHLDEVVLKISGVKHCAALGYSLYARA